MSGREPERPDRRRKAVILFRGLVPALGLIAGALVWTAPAAASCLPPDLPEQIRRADVIVYGRVSEVRQTFAAASGVIRFAPERLLKGTLARDVDVNLGPTHGGAVTSVDYAAGVRGERHTLYVRALADGTYETDACSGSHVGQPTSDEERLLGPGTSVGGGAGAAIDLVLAGVVLAAGVAAVALGSLMASDARRARVQPS